MNKLFIYYLLSILIGVQSVNAQTSEPLADLLNIKFKQGGLAQDESPLKFPILSGSLVPTTVYDSSVKKYVSKFRSSTGNEFFRFYYGDNAEFVNQLYKSFTIELYTKIKTSEKGTPFSSTQLGGIGIAQNDEKGNKFWFYQTNNTNAHVKGGSMYSSSNAQYDHLVYTYNQETQTLLFFQNGKLVNTTTNVKDLKLADQKYHWFFIGGDVSNVDNKAQFVYYGDIASVKMYAKNLSETEVSSLYAEIEARNSIQELDDVNDLISNLLPDYMGKETDAAKKQLANTYIEEGFDIIYSEKVDIEGVKQYINKVQDLLSQLIVSADLLDVKFLDDNLAKDVSGKGFELEQSSVLPYNSYDETIKQYVSSFSNYNISNSSRFYRINYKNNTDFKDKLQKSFTFELYLKARSPKFIAPVASTEGTGFGVSQVAGGGDLQFLFSDGTSNYNRIGGKSIYSATNPEYNHVVYTYNHTTKTLKSYFNGKLVASKTTLKNLVLPASANQYLFIGGDVGSNKAYAQFPFEGDIASVRIYSQALTNLEVNNIYQQVEKRKALPNADNLNEVIANKLPAYIANQSDISKKDVAENYLSEGWDLMNSLETTKADIDSYLNKVQANLGLNSTLASKNNLPRFAVISDVHIGWGSLDKNKVKKTIDILNNQNPALDALFIVGDITNDGYESQYMTAAELFSAVNPTIPIYSLLGNHDFWQDPKGAFFEPHFGDKHRTIDIKGYPFIILSDDPYDKTEGKETNYKESTLAYLRDALATVSVKYPGKPIFVYTHVSAYQTVLGSWGEVGVPFYEKSLREIFKQYEQVIVFSGHLHLPIGNEKSIHQEYFTAVNDGTIAYTTQIPMRDSNGSYNTIKMSDNKLKTHMPATDGTSVAEGLIVNVESNEDIKIQKWDFLRDEEIKTPWLVKAPHKKESFVYTNSRDGGQAPYFKSSDEVAFRSYKKDSTIITFPQAKDDDLVDRYIITVLDVNDKTIGEYYISSKYYLNSDMPAELSWIVGTPAKKQCQVKITALDSFGNASAPLLSQPFIDAVGVVSPTLKSLSLGQGEAPVILSNNNQIQIITNGFDIDNAVLYNISGKAIDSKNNQSSDFTLGKSITSGVYIVKIQYGEKTLNQKVILQ